MKWAGQALPAATASGTGVVLAALGKFMVGLLLLVGAVYSLGIVLQTDPRDETAFGPTDPRRVETLDIESVAGAEAPSPRTGEETERCALPETGPRLTGRVIDRGTGAPIPEFHMTLFGPEEGRGYWTPRVEETLRDEEGAFRIPLPGAGTYRLEVRSARHLPEVLHRVLLSGDVGGPDLEIAMDPGMTLRGRVIHRATGRPVAGALVGTDRGTPRSVFDAGPGFGDPLAAGETAYEVISRTDEAGRFALSGLEPGLQRIGAVLPGLAQGCVERDPAQGDPGEPLEIFLDEGHRISGRAFTDDGRPLPGLAIHVQGAASPLHRIVTTEDDGRFRTEGMGRGEIFLWTDPLDDPFSGASFTPEMKRVVMAGSDREVRFAVDEPEYVRWRGTARDGSGAPLARGALLINPLADNPWPAERFAEFMTSRRVALDERGRSSPRSSCPADTGSASFFRKREDSGPRTRAPSHSRSPASRIAISPWAARNSSAG